MKKKAAQVTLVTTLAVGLIFTTTFAEASTPRWPEPAWFAQFNQSQPTPAPEPAPQEPAPPEPKPAPQEPKPQEPAPQEPSSPTNHWLSPAWFNSYFGNQTQEPSNPTPTHPAPTNPAPTPTNPDPTPTNPAPSPIGLTSQERQVANLVNEERSNRGISSLAVDAELSEWARIKSQDMVDNNYFAHNSPTYGSASQMLRTGGVQVRFVGENLARTVSVSGGHTSLMNSNIHRANILNSSYTHVGVGIATKGSTLYITQLFAAK